MNLGELALLLKRFQETIPGLRQVLLDAQALANSRGGTAVAQALLTALYMAASGFIREYDATHGSSIPALPAQED